MKTVYILPIIALVSVPLQAAEPNKDQSLFDRNSQAIDRNVERGNVGNGDGRARPDPNDAKIVNQNSSTSDRLNSAADGNAAGPRNSPR